MGRSSFPVGRQPETLEDEIRDQAARTLATLFDSLYEGAFAVDRAANIIWMNDKFKALLGWNGIDPPEGKPVEEVVPGSQMREVVETGRAALLDIFTIGSQQVVVSRLPLTGKDGALTGALGVILYDRPQALKPLISKFQAMQTDLAEAHRALAEERRAKYTFAQYVGGSLAVAELKRQARRAAERDLAVLLLGETGTGKELLAHAIHAASPRAHKPMVCVNVAAIPETLLEAELFGTAPGAFTGADRKGRDGKFKIADGGTLFLDEIGDMPIAVQVKLLRVLQDGAFESLGSNAMRRVDVRVIAATSRDLPAMAESGAFRKDLYYRLNVLPLHLPPLRGHVEDLGMLCDVLLDQIAARMGEAPLTVDPSAIKRLAGHSWPGNVRELSNILEQACARNGGDVLSAASFDDILPAPSAAPDAPAGREPVQTLRVAVARAERTAIARALDAAGGVKSQAAKLLGISRAQFYEKLDRVSGDSDI